MGGKPKIKIDLSKITARSPRARFNQMLKIVLKAPPLKKSPFGKKQQMDSLDTAHVNPNPERDDLWRFVNFQPRVISPDFLSLELLSTASDSVYTEMRVKLADWVTLRDFLNLNKPCVVLRDLGGEPQVTFTVRSIEPGVAMIQITSNMPQVPRSYGPSRAL